MTVLLVKARNTVSLSGANALLRGGEGMAGGDFFPGIFPLAFYLVHPQNLGSYVTPRKILPAPQPQPKLGALITWSFSAVCFFFFFLNPQLMTCVMVHWPSVMHVHVVQSCLHRRNA